MGNIYMKRSLSRKDVKFVQNEVNRLIKMKLPNKKVLDINTQVLEQISKYTQNEICSNESGGLLVGYTHKKSMNIIIETVTEPQLKDLKSRISFKRKDPRHFALLNFFKKKKSDYLGTWHTHPQDVPYPSRVDILDWKDCLLKERTKNGYILFLIWGRNEFKIWAGDLNTKMIFELDEWPNNKGLYLKRKL